MWWRFLFSTLQSPETTLHLDAVQSSPFDYTWLFKSSGARKACLHTGIKGMSLSRGKIHSIYLALFPKCHREVSQSEIHFVRTDKSCHLSLACLLVHNKADFQSWEDFYSFFLLKSVHQQMETSVPVLPCLKHKVVVLANSADQLSFNDIVTQEHAVLF